MQILIYRDRGVDAASYYALFKIFSARDDKVLGVDAHFLSAREWERTADLIVFPGGRDLLYHKALQGVGNARIRRFVEGGGRYLGICAGGYYGASSIEFEKGERLEICGPRELSFFPGKAVGSAYGRGLFRYNSQKGARQAQIAWKGRVTPIYFNGGCFFHEIESYPEIEILASYSDLPLTPAAAIYCPCGEGGALLSGIHPELPPFQNIFWEYLISKLIKT